MRTAYGISGYLGMYPCTLWNKDPYRIMLLRRPIWIITVPKYPEDIFSPGAAKNCAQTMQSVSIMQLVIQKVSQADRLKYTWVDLKGDKFNDFPFAYLHIKSLLKKGSSLKGKNMLPLGANSFLSEKIPFQKGGKQFWKCCLPWVRVHFT